MEVEVYRRTKSTDLIYVCAAVTEEEATGVTEAILWLSNTRIKSRLTASVVASCHTRSCLQQLYIESMNVGESFSEMLCEHIADL